MVLLDGNLRCHQWFRYAHAEHFGPGGLRSRAFSANDRRDHYEEINHPRCCGAFIGIMAISRTDHSGRCRKLSFDHVVDMLNIMRSQRNSRARRVCVALQRPLNEAIGTAGDECA